MVGSKNRISGRVHSFRDCSLGPGIGNFPAGAQCLQERPGKLEILEQRPRFLTRPREGRARQLRTLQARRGPPGWGSEGAAGARGQRIRAERHPCFQTLAARDVPFPKSSNSVRAGFCLPAAVAPAAPSPRSHVTKAQLGGPEGWLPRVSLGGEGV